MLRGLLEIAEGPEAIVFEIKQPLRVVEWLFGPDGAMGWTRGSIGVRTAISPSVWTLLIQLPCVSVGDIQSGKLPTLHP